MALLVDLDDTICENNIYFERAIAEFIGFLDHKTHSPLEVRALLNEVERESIASLGYGLHSFTHALEAMFERHVDREVTPEQRQRIRGITQKIADHPLELIEQVPETIEYLAGRARLILMTKGHGPEQRGKVRCSGLEQYFSAVEVVAEKNEAAYREVVAKYSLDPAQTWMIGNSPKSDINPALAAGLHAVFIPHAMTWVLEHEELASPELPGQRLLVVERFAGLRSHF